MEIIISVLEQGLIYAIAALGIYITYKILDFPDLTADGSFTLGAAITSVLLLKNINPLLCIIISAICGFFAGAITGVIHVKFKVRDLLAGIITMMALYSINLRIVGKANITLMQVNSIFDIFNIGSISNIAMFIYLLFLNVLIENSWQFYTGIVSYILGLGLCSAAMVNFSFPDEVGFNNKGLYKFSRNPMYVAYFICFIGMALLTQSWILLGVVMLFQISAHWIILAEERWCILKFGKAYREYMKRVRRYI